MKFVCQGIVYPSHISAHKFYYCITIHCFISFKDHILELNGKHTGIKFFIVESESLRNGKVTIIKG